MPCPRYATGPTRSIPDGSRAWLNSAMSRFRTTASGRRSKTCPSRRCPARPSRWSARPAPANRPRLHCCIARALLKDPPILILDEATSALDAVTEAKVNAALDEVMKGRTTFVIAHRLATIRNATRILVFDSGHVIESGTFDELVAKGGRFAELARAQFMVQENARSSVAAPEIGSDAVKI